MVIDVIYISLIAVVFLAGLFLVGKNSILPYKLLLLFLCYTFFNELWSYHLKHTKQSSTEFYNVYFYFRYPIIGLMYYLLLPVKWFQRFIIGFWFLSVIMLCLNMFIFYGIHQLHVNYQALGGMFVILSALCHFYFILKNINVANPLKADFFWVSTGFFFYFLGIVPFFGIFNVLLKHDVIFIYIYQIIIKTLSILLYTFIGIDFYIQWKNLKSGPSL